MPATAVDRVVGRGAATEAPLFGLATELALGAGPSWGLTRLALECPHVGSGYLWRTLTDAFLLSTCGRQLVALALEGFHPRGDETVPAGTAVQGLLPACERLTVGLVDGAWDEGDLRLVAAAGGGGALRVLQLRLEGVTTCPRVTRAVVAGTLGRALRCCHTVDVAWTGSSLTDADVEALARAVAAAARSLSVLHLSLDDNPGVQRLSVLAGVFCRAATVSLRGLGATASISDFLPAWVLSGRGGAVLRVVAPETTGPADLMRCAGSLGGGGGAGAAGVLLHLDLGNTAADDASLAALCHALANCGARARVQVHRSGVTPALANLLPLVDARTLTVRYNRQRWY